MRRSLLGASCLLLGSVAGVAIAASSPQTHEAYCDVISGNNFNTVGALVTEQLNPLLKKRSAEGWELVGTSFQGQTIVSCFKRAVPK